jgi:hypothetical protein
MFKFLENHNYFMPAHFGGYEGQPKPCVYSDVTAMVINYQTDPEMLAQYVPEGFELTHPVLSLAYVMNHGVDWMAGGSYNLICVQVPVVYTREHLDGLYVLAVWENKTEPILPGRETTGIPKIFANIPDHRQLGDRSFANASYDGSAFLKMDFKRTRKMTPEELAAKNQQGKLNWFGWRYIPNIGKPGAALSHATLYPLESTFTAGWLGDGQVKWEALTWEQHPMQAHIVNALGQLPIKGYIGCEMTQKIQVLRNDIARQLP